MLTTKTLSEHQKSGVLYYGFPSFDAIPFVRHGFSTRIGGASRPPFHTMNLSFTRGDDALAVRENFDRFCAAIGVRAEDAVMTWQVHHTNVLNVTAADRGRGITRERNYNDADGLVTNEPDVVLCTLHADCVPLFFVDPVKRVIGLSHAGWRGTVAGIAAVTAAKMCADYGCRPEDILAGIGPSIGPCCFEVDPPVMEEFSHLPFFDGDCYRQKGEKYLIDLWEVNRRFLLSAGIADEHITVGDLCTHCHSDVFWSHRTTGPTRGSLAAFLSLCTL